MIKRILILLAVLVSVKVFSQADSLKIDRQKDSLGDNTFNLPLFSTSGGDLEGDLEQQDVSALLMSSRDVFTQFSSFQFGSARYRMRGYMAENQQVMINGVNVNNLETGFSSWSSWGGLNDVTRFMENRFGIVANRMNFSGVGGYTNIDSKASSFKKGTRISYASGNRIFQHRGMITHSTGMMQNGWAITVSGSFREGDAQRAPKVYMPGTYFNSYAYYVSVDKRINDRHLLSFTGYGAPTEQGRATPATAEAYALTNNHYYNPAWGYQDGKVRNASVSKTNRPMLMLSHIFNVSEDSKLTTTVYYNFGKSGLTWLNYNDGVNPYPNYYRYLPSYYYGQGDSINGDIVNNNWANNTDGLQQIRWDDLIAANQNNLFTTPPQMGQVNTSETRGIYVLENRIEDLKNIGFNTVFNKRVEKIFLSVGLNGNVYRDHKYKVVEDLLGASYWLDVDQFAENLGVDPQISQNNIDKPYNKVRKGDMFGYNYMININRAEVWGQAEYSLSKMDFYAGLSLSTSQTWREGLWANGKFPTDSKGKSEVVNLLNYGIKGGTTYRLSGRHFATANVAYLTRSPEAANMFISPRVRNDLVTGPGVITDDLNNIINVNGSIVTGGEKNNLMKTLSTGNRNANGIVSESVFSWDVNYIVRYPGLKVRLTYFYTAINNQTWVRTFWSDLYNNNVDLIMKGVNQTNQGVELGIEKTLFTSHVIQAAFSYGEYRYTNRPTLEAWQDNNATALFSDRTVYLKNYRVGGSPQMVSGIGYKYNGKKFWYAGIYFNYFDHIYVEPNPDRRTAEAVAGYQDSDADAVKHIVGQERLPAYYTINLNAGKSWRVMKKNYLRLNLMVNNLLNNQNIRTYGYEQLRWDYKNVDKFPTKYSYMPKITYMASVNFSF